jgi:hypothetical protein
LQVASYAPFVSVRPFLLNVPTLDGIVVYPPEQLDVPKTSYCGFSETTAARKAELLWTPFAQTVAQYEEQSDAENALLKTHEPTQPALSISNNWHQQYPLLPPIGVPFTAYVPLFDAHQCLPCTV